MKEALRKIYHSRALNVSAGAYGIFELAGGIVFIADYLTTGLYQSLMAPGFESLGGAEPAGGVLAMAVGSAGTAKYVSYKLRNRRLARESREKQP